LNNHVNSFKNKQNQPLLLVLRSFLSMVYLCINDSGEHVITPSVMTWCFVIDFEYFIILIYANYKAVLNSVSSRNVNDA